MSTVVVVVVVVQEQQEVWWRRSLRPGPLHPRALLGAHNTGAATCCLTLFRNNGSTPAVSTALKKTWMR